MSVVSEQKDAQNGADGFEDVEIEDILPEGPSNVCRKIKDDGTLVLYECKTGEVYFEGDPTSVDQ